MHINNIANLLCFGWMAFALCACDLSGSNGNRYEKISAAYCECTAQLAAVNRQAATANPSKLTEYFQKMQTEYTRAKECTATIVGQFGRLKTTELDTVNQYLLTKCPDLANKRDLLQEMLGD